MRRKWPPHVVAGHRSRNTRAEVSPTLGAMFTRQVPSGVPARAPAWESVTNKNSDSVQKRHSRTHPPTKQNLIILIEIYHVIEASTGYFDAQPAIFFEDFVCPLKFCET